MQFLQQEFDWLSRPWAVYEPLVIPCRKKKTGIINCLPVVLAKRNQQDLAIFLDHF